MELQSIMALDERYYMNTFGKRVPVAFSEGKGAILTSTDGQEYLDFMAGIAVCSLGHCNERVTEAIVAQAQKLVHTSCVYYIENQAVLAKMLCEAVKMDRVFFTSSGSEANEGMYKLARCCFSRRGEDKWEVISAKHSFHGRTLANTAATGQEKYQEPYKPLPQGFVNVEYNSLEAIEKAITPHTAAVILETIQAEGGVIEGGSDYLAGVQRLCRDKGLLFMLDEVQVGLGRTGEMTSYASMGLSPDIISVAKTLGNGFPIGAFLAKESVASAFKPGDHGGTYVGNPLACAAGIAVMKELTETNVLSNVKVVGAYMKHCLQELMQKHSVIADVRGRGLIIGIELKKELSAKEVQKGLFDRHILAGLAEGNVLRFIPPYIITVEQVQTVIAALDEILTK
ncbi:MAG: aspartate aminotransferase family protein [Eubacteriales bacterium]|nr:aspartate aminotransferase family protein [Eubacteriales bacterium]MDD3882315.1 aspartate aminotransferase family protein [Eubacteriales bacterium]MDD4512061.1 aspartate aminotransferase family protein [Eubacteriales bacterium]